MGICSMIQGAKNWCSVTTYSGGTGREEEGQFKREGTQVNLLLIHVDVRQKPSQYCKAIIHQLKLKLNKTNMFPSP